MASSVNGERAAGHSWGPSQQASPGEVRSEQHLFPAGSSAVGPLFNAVEVGCSVLVVPQGQGMHLTCGYRCHLGLRCTDAMQF